MKRIYVLFTALCVCCALAAQDIKELLIYTYIRPHKSVRMYNYMGIYVYKHVF